MFCAYIMHKSGIFAVLISILHCILGSNLEHDSSVMIRLQHALVSCENPDFTERGNITIQSLRLGQSIINQKPLSPDEQKDLRCMLVEAELDDRLSVSIDYVGRVIGVTLVIASKSTCEGSHSSIKPDTASYVQKLEKEREAKEKGEVKDNRSFLAKYVSTYC
ncbi:hypothetical protein NQ314_015695 [Rhamnusium bicolor]|uniref:Uncharacterized protein n=1 Tax=Rhamnusium bicolor TaxID=1586634 RepID=A0AAV8WY87_9CUCU|nr:hypothetical protein NQ314_015695 [Rhamnusium bicolor]